MKTQQKNPQVISSTSEFSPFISIQEQTAENDVPFLVTENRVIFSSNNVNVQEEVDFLTPEQVNKIRDSLWKSRTAEKF